MLETRVPQVIGTRIDLREVIDRLQALAEMDVNNAHRSRAVRIGHEFHPELIRLTQIGTRGPGDSRWLGWHAGVLSSWHAN
jgi:hypothetical protein